MLFPTIFKQQLKTKLAGQLPSQRKVVEIDPETGQQTTRVEQIDTISLINDSPFLNALLDCAAESVSYVKLNLDIIITNPLNTVAPMGTGVVTPGQILTKCAK